MMSDKRFSEAYNILNSLDTRFRGWEELNGWWADYYFQAGRKAETEKMYQEAISNFERSLSYLPDNSNLRLQLGYAYFNNKNYYDTILQFERIRDQFNGKDKLRISLDIARCYVLLENYTAAISEFKNLSYTYPDNTEILVEMALAQMKYHDYHGTVDSLERLQKLTALNTEQKDLLQQARKSIEVQENYATGISAHFRIVMDNQEFSQHIGSIIEILDSAYMVLGMRFDYSPRHHTKVMFLSRNDFAELTGAGGYVLGVHSGSSNEIHIPIDRINNFADTTELKNTLFHEYCHHIMFLKTQRNPSVPLWFHEGVAQLVEPEKDTERVSALLRKLISDDKLYRGSSIPGGFNGFPTPEFYAQALSIVKFIEHKRLLDELIMALPRLRGSIVFDDIFKDVTGQNVPEFIDKWREGLIELSKRSKP
jgi:tetratricopeptide (TPR) repeat protein